MNNSSRINEKSSIHRQHDDWDDVHNQLVEVQQKGFLQKKSLDISDPNDADEKEADEVARKVVGGGSTQVHGTGGTLNRKGEGSAETTPEFQSKLESSKGGGQPLDDSTRSEMESKIGADFSGVKIHTGGEANQMSESINAKAFTHGQDVYFKDGQHNTSSSEGKELLAHELVHTVQQGKSEVNRAIQRKADKNPTLGAAKKYFKSQISVLRAQQKQHKKDSDEFLKIENQINLIERLRDEVISTMKTDKKFVWTMHNYRVYLNNEALHSSANSIGEQEYDQVEASTFPEEMDEEERALRFSSGTIIGDDLDKKCRSAFADSEFKETEPVTAELKTVRELLSAKTAGELIDYSNNNDDATVDQAICGIIKDQNKLDGLSLPDLVALFTSYKFKDGQNYVWSVLSPKIDALSIEEILKIRDQQIFDLQENADRRKLLDDAIIKILSGYSTLELHKYLAAHSGNTTIERLTTGVLNEKLTKELGGKGALLFVTEAKRKADEKVDGEGYAALQKYMLDFVMGLQSTPGFYYTTQGEFLFHKPASAEQTSKENYDPLSESVLLWQVDKNDASKGQFELLRFPYSDRGEEKKPVTQYELLRTAAFGYNENTTYAQAQKLTISVAFNRDIKKKDKTLLDAWDEFGPGTPHSYMMSKYDNYADLYNAASNEALEVPGKSNQVTGKIRTGIKSSIESFQTGPSSVAIFEHGRDLLSAETTESPYNYAKLNVSIDYYSDDNIKKRQEAWDKEKAKEVEELDKALNKSYPNAKDSKTRESVRKTKMAEIDKKYADKKIADNVYWKWPAHWINYLAEGFRYANAGDISKGWYKPENFIKGQDFHPDENGNKAKYEKKGEETNGYRLVCVGTAGGNLFLINDPDVSYPDISAYKPQNWSIKSKPKGT